jgi:hypothetical protein
VYRIHRFVAQCRGSTRPSICKVPCRRSPLIPFK